MKISILNQIYILCYIHFICWRVTLAQLVKLLSSNWKGMDSGPENNVFFFTFTSYVVLQKLISYVL